MAGAPARPLSTVVPSSLILLAIFVPSVLDGFYEGLALPHSEQLHWLGTLFFVVSLWSWFGSYCREHGIPWPMDMACFLAILWPVLVPYYVFKTEGRRGWSLLGIYFMTALAAWAAGEALSIWLRVLLRRAA